MKAHILAITAALALTPRGSSRAQGTFVYDQQSAIEPNYGEVFETISAFQPAQSFTPTLSSIAFIRLAVSDNFSGDTMNGVLYVNLRQNSITGPILAASVPVTLPPGFGGPVNFFFSTPVTLTPGATYFFDPQIQSGALSWGITGSRLFTYAGGTAYSQGVPVSGDWWFREGIVVPEPSTFALLVVGAVTVACLRQRKSR